MVSLSNRQAVYATYLLIGDAHTGDTTACIDKMEVDKASQNIIPSQRKIMLVGESGLEGA